MATIEIWKKLEDYPLKIQEDAHLRHTYMKVTSDDGEIKCWYERNPM